MESVSLVPHDDEEIPVTITLRRSTYERAWEIVSANDPEWCPLHLMEGPTTAEDFLAWLVEQKLR